jgi:UDP-N-acetylglucosamine/UDP-N-acetylgalactosamine diphosphorylase
VTDRDGVRRLLAAHGQEHLLAGADSLDALVLEPFLERLASVEWDELEHVAQPPAPGAVRPADVLTLDGRRRRKPELRAAGEELYRRGAVAVLMVAGGQGTRLGFKGPKGCYPLAPHSRKTIYQLQSEKLLNVSRRVGRDVPFLVMTSPVTDGATREFFDANESFGLAPEQLAFFVQGTVPSVDREGRGLLAAPGVLLENPDGHGGAFTALVRSGELQRLQSGGIEQIVYLQVDNVLAPVDDPELVGLASVERADVVTKVLEKLHPDEKLGHLVTQGDRDRVIEYTELTPEQVRFRTDDGELLYRWGSPAMHCWSVDFLARLSGRGFRPPLHRSAKPLKAWVDGAVREVEGWKYERFIFDLIPEAKRSIGMEIDRYAEFAPVKNAEGDDSPATAVRLAHRQYVEWLERAGVRVRVPEDELLEISPLFAANAAQLAERWDGRPRELTRGAYID